MYFFPHSLKQSDVLNLFLKSQKDGKIFIFYLHFSQLCFFSIGYLWNTKISFYIPHATPLESRSFNAKRKIDRQTQRQSKTQTDQQIINDF